MEPNTMVTLAKMGAAAALGIAAMGSALGCGTAGRHVAHELHLEQGC